MEKFTIEHQWKLYLDRIKMKEEAMSPIQRIETKRAFFAACGQLLFLMRDDVAEYPEDQAIKILESMTEEVAQFWLKQTNRTN